MSGHESEADPALDEALSLITRRLRSQVSQPEPMPSGLRAGTLPEIARTLYRERRAREKFLEGLADLAEPAWDILLDLYIARAEDRKVGVSSACIAAAVPPTTGLRWLALLEGSGAVEREIDPHDRRRTYVGLSAKGEAAMSAYLRSIADSR